MEEYPPTNPLSPEPTPEPSPEPSRIRNVRVLILATVALLGTVVVVLFTFLPPRNDLLRTQLVGPGGDGGVPPSGEEPSTGEEPEMFFSQNWDSPTISFTSDVNVEEEDMCLPTPSPDSLGIAPSRVRTVLSRFFGTQTSSSASSKDSVQPPLLGLDAHAQTTVTCAAVGTEKLSPYRFEGFDKYKVVPVNMPSTDAKEIRRAMCTGSLSACKVGKDGKPVPSDDAIFYTADGGATSGCTLSHTLAPQGFKYHALMSKKEKSPTETTDTWTFIEGEAPHCANTPPLVAVKPIYPASGCPKTGIQPAGGGVMYYKSLSEAQQTAVAEQLGQDVLQKLLRFSDALLAHEQRHGAINTAFFKQMQEIINGIGVPAGSMIAVPTGQRPEEKIDEIIFTGLQVRVKEAEKAREDQHKAFHREEEKDTSPLKQALCDSCREFFTWCKDVPAPGVPPPKP